MDLFFKQESAASDAGFYFLALAGALLIPDICGALESSDGEATGSRYAQWFNTNMAHRYGPTSFLDGQTCYLFRCSMLHQGRLQHPKSSYSRILFVEPPAPMTMHMNVLSDALNIDVTTFCADMVTVAVTWQQIMAGTEPYQTNIQQAVARHPTGLSPYIGGIPVIS